MQITEEPFYKYLSECLVWDLNYRPSQGARSFTATAAATTAKPYIVPTRD